jgi:hypothetical protein
MINNSIINTIATNDIATIEYPEPNHASISFANLNAES